MSDDEEEGRLRIDESPSDSEDKPEVRAPPPPPAAETMPLLAMPSQSIKPSTTTDEASKEDGELDEDEEDGEEEEEEEQEQEEEDEAMDTDNDEPKLEIDEDYVEPAKVPVAAEPKKVAETEEKVKIEKEETVTSEPPSPAPSSKLSADIEMKEEDLSEEPIIKDELETSSEAPSTSSSKADSKSPTPSVKKENGLMKPPQSTEKPHRKRKESTDSFPTEKRKPGIEGNSSSSSAASSSDLLLTPQRSKRSSSHMAKLAISAMYTDDGEIVSVPAMPIGRTPEMGTQPKRAKRDQSTSVITTRGTDVAGLLTNESLLSTPPGTQLTLDVTIMYHLKASTVFRIKGCDLFGFIQDGNPPHMQLFANNASSSGNNNTKKKSNAANNDDGKDGRTSSASTNGRAGRAGSVAKDGKTEKQKGKKKKEETNDDDLDEDSQNNEQGSAKYELHEVDLSQYHECQFEGCEKRYPLFQELEYHVKHAHKEPKPVYESICTQTETSSLETKDAETEIDDELPPMPQMPVLKKEVPIKGSTGHVYEDLSDDDDGKPTDLALKQPSSSAAAALMGIAQASSTSNPSSIVPRTTPSTPVSAKIGINPSMVAQVQAHNAMVEKQKLQQQQQRNNTIATNSPRPNQPSTSNPATTAPSVQPPNMMQAHPMAGFIPAGFHPGLMVNHQQMAAMAAMDPRIDPRIAVALSQQHQQQQQQQQQQMSRTPSRQTMVVSDPHKIHELAAKSKENEQRQRQQTNTPKTPANQGVPGGTPQRQFITPQMMQHPGTPQSVQQQQHQQQQQQAAVAAQAQHQLMQQMQLQMQRGMVPQMAQPELLMMMMGMGIPMGPGAPGFPGQPPQQPPK